MQFPQTHNEMENIWTKLHPLMENKHVVDLDDYTNISGNDMLVATLKKGLKKV